MSEILQCEIVDECKMIMKVQEKESETNIANLLCHQKIRSQKKLQQRNAYITNNFCMPYELTIQGDAIIFACFDEPQNSVFQFPLISIHISITCIDGSPISNPLVMRKNVQTALEKAVKNGVIHNLF